MTTVTLRVYLKFTVLHKRHDKNTIRSGQRDQIARQEYVVVLQEYRMKQGQDFIGITEIRNRLTVIRGRHYKNIFSSYSP